MFNILVGGIATSRHGALTTMRARDRRWTELDPTNNISDAHKQATVCGQDPVRLNGSEGVLRRTPEFMEIAVPVRDEKEEIQESPRSPKLKRLHDGDDADLLCRHEVSGRCFVCSSVRWENRPYYIHTYMHASSAEFSHACSTTHPPVRPALASEPRQPNLLCRTGPSESSQSKKS